MQNPEKTASLVTRLATEIYYGINFAIVLSSATDAEFSAMESIIKKAEETRAEIAARRA